MAEKEYRRLTGARMRRTGAITAFATRSSLWLGKDHLLCIDSTGYAEEYKRFYFRDIQAVVLRQTRRRLWWNVVLVPLALGFLSLFMATAPGTSPSSWSSGEIVGGAFLGSVTFFFVLLALFNTFSGPACICHLRTAVQTEELPSLNRVRRVGKVLGRVRPLIETEQGRLAPEEIASSLANPSGADTPPVISRYTTTPAASPPRYYFGTAHLILFWLLLADLPMTAPHFFFEAGWLTTLSVLFLCTHVGVAITALIKQRNTNLPGSVKNIPWISLVTTALFFLSQIIYGFVLAVTDPEVRETSFSPMDNVMVMIISVASTAINAALGAIGLVSLRRFRATGPSEVAAPP